MAKSKSTTRSSKVVKTPKPKTKTKTKTPCTPTGEGGVRRFFFKLELLGQRRLVDPLRDLRHWQRQYMRDEADKTPTQRPTAPNENADKPVVSCAHTHSHHHSHPAPACTQPRNFQVALQNHDTSHPDTIIISTLNLSCPPFCCHEDLLSMTRPQLVKVADALNARLPCALGIDTEEGRPESWIRSDIEWVVGIRSEREYGREVEVEVPGAPRAVRTWSTGLGGSWGSGGEVLDDLALREAERSPPTSPSPSPLTRKSLQMSPRSPRLERLAEEEEGEEEGSESLVLVNNVGRAAKRRRAGGRAMKRRKVTGGEDMEVDEETGLTPMVPASRIPRLRSSAAVANGSPTPRRVLRSHSHNLGKKPSAETISNASGMRVLSRDAQSKSEVAKAFKMGTPRKTRSLRPLNGYRPFLAPEDDSGRSRAGSNASTSTSASLLNVKECQSGRNMKRKRGVGDEMAWGIDMDMDVDVFP